MRNSNLRICRSNRVSRSLFAIAILIPAACSATAQTYDVTDLGLIGGPEARAFAINAAGNVAGYAIDGNGDIHAIFWDGVLQDLGVLPADTQSHGFALNDSDHVVAGSYTMGSLVTQCLLWDGGIKTNLGTFRPRDLNNGGLVAGAVALTNANGLHIEHACQFSSGILSDLGTLGGTNSEAMAVNNAGWIVGQSQLTGDTQIHAALWNGGWRDLGTLGGANSAAYDINNSGMVAGFSDAASGEPHACRFVLDPAGNVLSRTDLGVLGGGYSYAYGLNNLGEIVGTSDSRAFLWDGATIVDLNSRLPAGSAWELEIAQAINDAGQIVGIGRIRGEYHAFRLEPGGSECFGDLDGDLLVGPQDLALLLSSFLVDAGGDLDQSGMTDAQDLALLLAAWGTDCN